MAATSYALTETLRQDGDIILRRGTGAGGAPVLVLGSARPHPPPLTLARFEHEYALRARLDPTWAAHPLALAEHDGQRVLVSEDPGGELLKDLLARRPAGEPMALESFLAIAVELSLALGQMHERGLIHKDLKPANVLVAGDPEAGEVSVHLTGFGIASRQPRERQRPEPPEIMAGTFAYMAPEQTGRMNRSLDSRADLYSFGILCYEMLTGALPFAATDAMEWVHCHVARQPTPPIERRSDLPRPLSDLVIKLLAKAAEDRYQSAAGVAADLRRCQHEWSTRRRIDAFPLATADAPDRLRIPERLYGREHAVEALLAAFERMRARGQLEFVFVRGYAGIGKSSVVNEINKALIAPRGLFATGKFDQFQRDIPYATLGQALQGLVRALLVQSDAVLAGWRQSLQAALADQAGLLVSLVPEFELVIGPQPAVPEVAPREAENRFLAVLSRCLGVFARDEHPLVLFLDDLQWLDAATLKFLEHLANIAPTDPEPHHLLLIGAYRDNEVDGAHPLAGTLEVIRKSGVGLSEIVLEPLSAVDIERLVADALRCEPESAAELAQLTHEKTGGNPFFAIQFLMALADERLLKFDVDQMRWRCDQSRAHAKVNTDNVIDLMVGKLKRLPAASREVLKRLACLGNAVDAATLALLHGCPAEAVEAQIGPAITAGLVLRRQDTEVGYEFVHDRVREAAYALIPASERAAEHLRAGRLLVANLPPEAIAARIFDVAGQLNRGIDLITDPGERLVLSRLNVDAGRKAKEAIAYTAAADHLAQAMALLPPAAWETDYAATFALHLDRAECEHLAGHTEQADRLFEQALAHARSPLDRASVCRLHSRLYQTSGNFDKAMALLIDSLHMLGVTLPDTEAAVLAAAENEIGRIKAALAGRTVASLSEAPMATDPTGALIIALFVEAFGPAYAAKPAHFPLCAAKAVSATLHYGNTVESTLAYAAYAIVLVAGPREVPVAYEFSRMALALLERFENPRPRGLVLVAHGAMVSPWCRHVAEGLPLVEQGLAALLHSGDFLNAAYSIMFPVWTALEAGQPLDKVLSTADRYAAFAGQVHNELALETVRLCRRSLVRLSGSADDLARLGADDFSEAECLARFARTGWDIGLAYHHVISLMAAFIGGNHAEAMTSAAAAFAVLRHRMPMPAAATLCFYRALTLAALCRRAPPDKRDDYARTLGDDLRKFKHWANNGPQNFEHRYALAAAEVARNEGRELDAERLYEQAIESADKHGFVHHAALANELAADFYRDRGFRTTALAYLRNARYGYQQWGAIGKVTALDASHPGGLELPPSTATAATIATPVEHLDAITAVKASQAVWGEIVPEQLIQTLMRITVEHAAAERGLLLLADENSYRIAAEATTSRRVDVNLRQDSPQPHEAPESLLRYVLRTRQPVLLSDASTPHPFTEDAYWRGRTPRSVLCLPLVKAKSLVGLLYLENTLTAHAFSRQRVAVLELLASQAAIALENATLYAGLRQENTERQRAETRFKRLVESNIIGVFFWDMTAPGPPDGGHPPRGSRNLGAALQFLESGGVSSANDAFLKIAGYPREDLDAGRLRWLDITAPEYLPAVERAVKELEQSGACMPYEMAIIRKDGARVPVLVGLALFEGSADEGVGFVLDLSERQRAEAERQARLAADAANEAKGDFLARMSHELRSPLNTILGFSRLMAREPDLPEAAREDLARILRSGEHLHALINNVLDLSKIESGRETLNESDFDLSTMLDELRDVFSATAESKGLLFVLARRRGVPRHIRSDPLKLRQVLTNLIGNAIKFTPPGGRITLGVDRIVSDQAGDAENRARLAFTVADTGSGIAADELPTLFDAFAQGKSGRHEREGSGLGLAISRGIVRLMGGDIHLVSTLGRGTTARAEIVVQLVAASANRDTNERSARRAVGLEPGQPSYRLLVVDDDPEARQLVVRLLAPLGFELNEAADGEQAVELARQRQPQLIWMDMLMPGIDGGEATRRIRALAQKPSPVIIALTASAFDDERARALSEGCNDLLRKPFRENDLFAALEEQLGVRLVYEDHVAATSVVAASPPAVPADARNRLPEALRAQLAAALRGLDMAAVDSALGAVAECDRGLAAALAALAADFQYDGILRLIGDTEPPPDREYSHESE